MSRRELFPHNVDAIAHWVDSHYRAVKEKFYQAALHCRGVSVDRNEKHFLITSSASTDSGHLKNATYQLEIISNGYMRMKV